MMFADFEIFPDDDNDYHYRVTNGGDSEIELSYIEKDRKDEIIGMSCQVAKEVAVALLKAVEDFERREKVAK